MELIATVLHHGLPTLVCYWPQATEELDLLRAERAEEAGALSRVEGLPEKCRRQADSLTPVLQVCAGGGWALGQHPDDVCLAVICWQVRKQAAGAATAAVTIATA